MDYPENRTDAVETQYTADDPEDVATITSWSLDGDDKDLFDISTAGVLDIQLVNLTTMLRATKTATTFTW